MNASAIHAANFTETDTTPRRCLTGTARARYLLQGHQFRRNRRLARQARDHLPVPPDARPQPSRSPLRPLLDLQANRREMVVKLLDAARRTTNEQIAHWRRRSVQQNYLRPIPVEPHWALRLVDQRIETERQRVRMLAAAEGCAAALYGFAA